MNERKNQKQIEKYGNSGMALVDTETGEMTELPYGAKIILPPLEVDENGQCSFSKEGMTYMKVFINCDEVLLDTLSDKEYIFLQKIKRYIPFKENVLRKGGRYNGAFLTKKDLATEFGISPRQIDRYLSSLMDKDIIKYFQMPCDDNPKITNGCYILCPWIYCKGNKMKAIICEQFKDSVWRYLAFAKSKSEVEEILSTHFGQRE